MRIEDAKVIVCSPGRNFVTLKITVEGGLTGIGDATLNGRELAVVAYLQDHVIPLLIGRDARRIEDTWQLLYRGAYWRRGPVTMRAIAAVDMALWDIKAKAAGMPLYDLLGGKSREGVLVYGHANGADIEAHLRRGRALCGPGLQGGARAERRAGARQALRRLGRPHVLRAGRRGAADRDRLVDAEVPRPHAEAVRAAARARWASGSSCCTTCTIASRRSRRRGSARRWSPIALFWLEDPTPAENQEAFRLIRQHTTTPLAVGEVFNTIWDAKDLIAGAADRLHPRHRGRRRRDHPPAPHRRLRRPSGRCAPAATARPTCRR